MRMLTELSVCLIVAALITRGSIARVRRIPSAPKGAAMLVVMLIIGYPASLNENDIVEFVDERRRYIAQSLLSLVLIIFGADFLLN